MIRWPHPKEIFWLLFQISQEGMEIQTKPILKVRTPRVKCIISHPSYPDVIVCMFTGEITIFDPTTLQLKKSIQVSSVPIRTGAIIPSRDWILMGNDEGSIMVLDIGNFTVLDVIQAHDDFIRKIVVDEANCRFVTVSDDNRTKLWSFKDEIVQISKYKDSKHFVMDACFYPSDHSQFFTVSLDGKVRLYSVSSTKCLKTYKGHEKGVNSIAFINSDTFVTGSDDAMVMVWDVKRPQPITVLRGHTNNVNRVQATKNGFASCSEDTSVRFWNYDLKTIEVISMQGRVWDLCVKNGNVFVGSDEELAVFQEIRACSRAFMCGNKIFYNVKNVLNSVKADEIGAFKEIGSLDEDYETFAVNENGKLVVVAKKGEFAMYSTLGMRKKYSDQGKSPCFLGPDGLVYLKDQEIVVVRKNERECSFPIDGASRILLAEGDRVFVNGSRTCLYAISQQGCELVHEFGIRAHSAAFIGECFILIDEKIHVYGRDFSEVESLDYEVESFCISEDIFYFSTQNKSFYLMIAGDKVYLSSMRFHSSLIGVREDILFYFANGIQQERLDLEFIRFQKDFFLGRDPVPGEHIRDKAISFLESLGHYDEALAMCTDENQKFEILIKLGNLEDALKSANSPVMFEKLGKTFFNRGNMARAAECFYKSNSIDSLFLADVFGDKKYLGYVARTAKENGQNNISFLASYKNSDFEDCKALLRDTPFCNAFGKFYCHQ